MASAALPRGPQSRFVVDTLLEYARDPLGFLTRQARRHGDIILLNARGIPIYLLNHPDLIEEVLVTHNRAFIKDKDTRDSLRPLGNGLLVSEGDVWRRWRRLAQPTFHRERLVAYGETMVARTEQMLAGWRGGEVRDIHRDLMRLTLRIVAETLFGADTSGDAETVGDALATVMAHASEQGIRLFLRLVPDRVPTPGNLRYRAAVGCLDTVIRDIIGARRAGGQDTGDLLSLLLRASDEEGRGMDDRQLRDDALTIIAAGHETTAVALSWTFYLLATHPEAEAALLAELREALGDRPPAVADLPRLRYTAMVVKESMRLYPPAWAIGREAIDRRTIGGYDVPPGAQVMMSQWVTHHDPRYFELPRQFIPERWTDDFEKGLPKYAYFPFGGGPRLCIGSSFATMEATLLLAAIARRFRLRLAPRRGWRVAPQPSITLRRATLLAKWSRRRNLEDYERAYMTWSSLLRRPHFLPSRPFMPSGSHISKRAIAPDVAALRTYFINLA